MTSELRGMEKVTTADVDLQGGAESWAADSRSAGLGSDD